MTDDEYDPIEEDQPDTHWFLKTAEMPAFFLGAAVGLLLGCIIVVAIAAPFIGASR